VETRADLQDEVAIRVQGRVCHSWETVAGSLLASYRAYGAACRTPVSRRTRRGQRVCSSWPTGCGVHNVVDGDGSLLGTGTPSREKCRM